jgi:O-antigen/teichoic acid export membrane protein
MILQDENVNVSESPLTSRVIRGAGWSFAGKGIVYIFDVARLIVVARMVSPRDFGLYGITMLALAVLEAFTETGFNAALIQKQQSVEDYLDTAWTVQAIRGIVLTLVLFVLSPLIGSFFHEPRVTDILRVLCLTETVKGVSNVGIVYFRKTLRFERQVLYEVPAAAVGLVVTGGLAILLHSVWALVWGTLATWTARCILSYVLHPYRPRIRLNRSRGVGLFQFGRWVMASNTVVLLATQGGDAVAGRILGATALGIYQVTYRLANTVATQITHTISGVIFPAFATIQDERFRLGRAYIETFHLTCLLTVPFACLIGVFAPFVLQALLGPQWVAGTTCLRVLAIAGLIRSMTATNGPLVYAVGHPKVAFLQDLIRALVVLPGAFALGHLYGIEGVAFAVCVSLIACVPVWIWSLRRYLDTAPGSILWAIINPLLLSAAALVPALLVRSIIDSPLIYTIVASVLFCATYFALLVTTQARVRMILATLLASLFGRRGAYAQDMA